MALTEAGFVVSQGLYREEPASPAAEGVPEEGGSA
jgi:hypothetical protein